MIAQQLKKKQSVVVKGLERQINFDLDCNGMLFRLNGNVDRIDEIGGQTRILDYKTGLVKTEELAFADFKDLKDKKSKSKAFQLMVYAYLHFKNQKSGDVVFTAGNMSFKNMKNGMLPIRFGKSNSPELEIDSQVIQQFEDVLIELFKEIKDESRDFTQTEEVSRCTYCDFKAVCGRV